MKLRIQGNSIRLRVTQREAAALEAGERLESWVRFGPAPADRLGYAIEVSPDLAEVRASYAGGALVVALPAGVARTWAGTNQVGIEHSQVVDVGEALEIVVEKDFHER